MARQDEGLNFTLERSLTSLKLSTFLLFPLSLRHINGDMNKTDKSALVKKLEAKRTANAYINTSRCIHSRRHPVDISCELFPTFGGGIAFVILQKASTHSKTSRIVCDTYKDVPSINGYEQEQTGSYQCRYSITGTPQRRPANFNQALLSLSFKTALLQFRRDECCFPCNGRKLPFVHIS